MEEEMMEIHRQTCQKCRCKRMRNLIVREEGAGDVIFVQCTECMDLVARYKIAHKGYYHHGKGFESYLRGLNRGGDFMSGKDIQEEFHRVRAGSLEQFEKVLKELARQGKTDDLRIQ